MGVYDFGKSVPWREAVDLLDQVLKTHGSRTVAKSQDWDYPITREEITQKTMLQVALYANHQGKGKPIQVEYPWSNADNKVDDKTKADLIARFKAQSVTEQLELDHN